MTNKFSDKEYPPANFCIYCGDTDSPLGGEHIVPLSLNGNLIIPRASCRKCAKMTGWLERICSRQMFGPYRVRHGFDTRHPKDREKPYPLNYFDEHGVKTSVPMPLADHPTSLSFPILPPPNILTGNPPPNPDGPFKCEMLFLGSKLDANIADQVAAEKKAQAVHMGSLDIAAFARVLAKIGHAYTYAETNGFSDEWNPFLIDTIFGRFRSFHHFVGTLADADVSPEKGTLHKLDIVKAKTKGKTYLGMDIRLFAHEMGTPTFRVITAERMGQLEQE